MGGRALRSARQPEPGGDLLTPLRIYQVRKQSKDTAALQAMKLGSQRIAAGDRAELN